MCEWIKGDTKLRLVKLQTTLAQLSWPLQLKVGSTKTSNQLNWHVWVSPMQSSSTSGADGHADPKPNGRRTPLNKWITINGQALIPHKLLFSKKGLKGII